LVDTNVAKSATNQAKHSVSKACLKLALTLKDKNCPTGAAMTPLLRAEWRRHASPMMTGWLASMEARGRLRSERDRRVKDLRVALAAEPDPGIRLELEKDMHLSEAALSYGFAVVSRDSKQRAFLGRIAGHYAPAGGIRWVDPVDDQSQWESWLRHGCSSTSYCVVPAP
jgi:hypothetical protein